MRTTQPFKSRAARVYTRKDGAFLVKIHTGEGYATRVFHRLSEANECAKKAAKEAAKNGVMYAIPLSAPERAVLTALREAAAAGSDAQAVAGAAIDAIRRRSRAKIPVSRFIGSFIEAVAGNGNAARARRIRQRVSTFVAALPAEAVSEISASVAASAVGAITAKLSQATAKDWISTIRAFVIFACEQAGIPAPTIRVPARAKPRNRIETLSNEQVSALLSRAKVITPEFYPAIVLQTFCGLRASEALRLRCGDIRGNEIFLSREITKTAQARRVPIPGNARALLSAIASNPPSGFAVARDIGGDERRAQAYAVALRTVERLPRNVLRKTAISNYCALVGNAKAADICGNSIATQGEYYRDLKSADDAREFFGIAVCDCH